MNDNDPATIIEVDTFETIAGYIPSMNRIEISKYFHEFPELYAHILAHEKEHAKIQLKYGYSWRHIWFDIKDRWKLYRNYEKMEQFRQFKRLTNPRSRQGKIFRIAYFLSMIPQGFFFDFVLLGSTLHYYLKSIIRRRNLHE